MKKPTIYGIVRDALACRGTPAKQARRFRILATMTRKALRQYDAECAKRGLAP
jgi:hypothetical protein